MTIFNEVTINDKVCVLAYKHEFAGNMVRFCMHAARAWARDYPEIFEAYLRAYSASKHKPERRFA